MAAKYFEGLNQTFGEMVLCEIKFYVDDETIKSVKAIARGIGFCATSTLRKKCTHMAIFVFFGNKIYILTDIELLITDHVQFKPTFRIKLV